VKSTSTRLLPDKRRQTEICNNPEQIHTQPASDNGSNSPLTITMTQPSPGNTCRSAQMRCAAARSQKLKTTVIAIIFSLVRFFHRTGDLRSVISSRFIRVGLGLFPFLTCKIGLTGFHAKDTSLPMSVDTPLTRGSPLGQQHEEEPDGQHDDIHQSEERSGAILPANFMVSHSRSV